MTPRHEGQPIPFHERSGLPVLPEGWHFRVEPEDFGELDGTGPVTITIQAGGVSANSSWMNGPAIDSATVPERWHWLIRRAAIKLYRRNVTGGEMGRRTPWEPPKRWYARYDLITQYREENNL